MCQVNKNWAKNVSIVIIYYINKHYFIILASQFPSWQVDFNITHPDGWVASYSYVKYCSSKLQSKLMLGFSVSSFCPDVNAVLLMSHSLVLIFSILLINICPGNLLILVLCWTLVMVSLCCVLVDHCIGQRFFDSPFCVHVTCPNSVCIPHYQGDLILLFFACKRLGSHCVCWVLFPFSF